MKKILCIYTGGTIGCMPGPEGLAPVPDVLRQPLQALAEKSVRGVSLVLQEYPQLLDSSSMGPQHWNQIAADIAANYACYDGFIVLHGTDTLAYSASALSFQLENLAKPVVITGSQRPWFQPDSDAPANVALALQWVVQDWSGVRVCFGGRCLPGNRVRKVDADQDVAFAAPNWNNVWADRNGLDAPLQCQHVDMKSRILALRLFPGFTPDWLQIALQQPVQALVLENFGSGNLPEHAGLIAALQAQSEQGAVIVNCSQCLAGRVQQGHYAAGAPLALMGALPAGDMTSEAVLSKLYYLFSKGKTLSQIREGFMLNLCGERSF